MVKDDLTKKYNVAAPRYTSYPTVPYWDTAYFNLSTWKTSVKQTFDQTNESDGISLYIHLPFCENLCTYCGCNTKITKNHRVEEPYINAVLQEWDEYCAIIVGTPVIKEIHLGGGTPTFFSAANLKRLINGILKDVHVHPNAEFGFEAHPANTTADHLEVLFKLGFTRLSLGIQDFDPAVQHVINRRQTYNQVQAVTQLARKIGYTSINYDLIYGLPLQTLDGLINTMDLVSGLRPDRIAFYSYAHVPWLKPGQRLFTENDLPDAETKTKLYEIGRNLLLYFGYKEFGMDHFALPADTLSIAALSGKLHRNFMGYTHQHTQLLIGLGVSAISDSGNAFAQNVKTVDEYLNLVKHDLPIVKGHLLTGEDLIIRNHITNIMCNGYTSWKYSTETCEAFMEGLGRLKPLEEDGLVELSAEELKVTLLGKGFLRNICMALDARLFAEKRMNAQFSMSV